MDERLDGTPPEQTTVPDDGRATTDDHARAMQTPADAPSEKKITPLPPAKRTSGKRPMPSSRASIIHSPAATTTGSSTAAAEAATARVEIGADEDVLDHPSFARLSTLLDRMFELEDRMAVGDRDDLDARLSLSDATQLQRELAKLKPSGQLHRVAVTALERLLAVFGGAVELARRQQPSDEDDDEDDPEFVEPTMHLKL